MLSSSFFCRVNGFRAITDVVDGSFWILNTMISSIFYIFRDKLDRKRQKSANFQNWKVYFSSNFNTYLQSGHLNAWVTSDILFQNGVKWGPHYEILHVRSAYRICIFHPIFMRFLFFEFIELSNMDRYVTIRAISKQIIFTVQKWLWNDIDSISHMYNINLNRYQFTVVCNTRIYIPQYTLRIPVSFPFSSVFSMLGKYEQYFFFYKSM